MSQTIHVSNNTKEDLLCEIQTERNDHHGNLKGLGLDKLEKFIFDKIFKAINGDPRPKDILKPGETRKSETEWYDELGGQSPFSMIYIAKPDRSGVAAIQSGIDCSWVIEDDGIYRVAHHNLFEKKTSVPHYDWNSQKVEP